MGKHLPPDARSKHCELWLSKGCNDLQELILGIRWDCLGIFLFTTRANVFIQDIWEQDIKQDDQNELREWLYGSPTCLHTVIHHGPVSTWFVMARLRMAPEKCLSMPHLELSAALTWRPACQAFLNQADIPLVRFPFGTAMDKIRVVLLCLLQGGCRLEICGLCNTLFYFFFTIANLMFVASEPYKTSVLNKTPPFCFIF